MVGALRLPLGALSVLLFVVTTATAQVSFVAFESGPVRPLALSPDRSRLFALNTPDNHLEVFDVAGGSFERVASIAVGMEPVAVAARSNSEVWVVNHLSDSVSIVDLSASPPQVVRTLLVGDEPRDIVFAGTGGNRAFITTAHRGQHRTDFSITGTRGGNKKSDVKGGGDPQLTTPGIGRADVWVFDASNLGASIGGTPLEILTLFGDTPRALAVSPDGNTVYAAIFHSLTIQQMKIVEQSRAKIPARRGAALALLATAGCSFAPAPQLPQPVADLPETFLESEAIGVYAPVEWWRDFDDPTLDTLIDSALVSNLDLVPRQPGV